MKERIRNWKRRKSSSGDDSDIENETESKEVMPRIQSAPAFTSTPKPNNQKVKGKLRRRNTCPAEPMHINSNFKVLNKI